MEEPAGGGMDGEVGVATGAEASAVVTAEGVAGDADEGAEAESGWVGAAGCPSVDAAEAAAIGSTAAFVGPSLIGCVGRERAEVDAGAPPICV